jgi:hypothetical protein
VMATLILLFCLGYVIGKLIAIMCWVIINCINGVNSKCCLSKNWERPWKWP